MLENVLGGRMVTAEITKSAIVSAMHVVFICILQIDRNQFQKYFKVHPVFSVGLVTTRFFCWFFSVCSKDTRLVALLIRSSVSGS